MKLRPPRSTYEAALQGIARFIAETVSRWERRWARTDKNYRRLHPLVMKDLTEQWNRAVPMSHTRALAQCREALREARKKLDGQRKKAQRKNERTKA